MERNQNENRIRLIMLGAALFAIVVSALDVLNIVPDVAGKLTPLLIGILILYLVSESDSLNTIRALLRAAKRKIDRLDDDRKAQRQPNQPPPKGTVRGKKPAVKSPIYREIKWHGLVFRSQSEIKIAKELDRIGAVFIPSCKIRLNTENNRQTREVDFLIYHQGQWGVLEVDGPHHSQSAAADNWRDDRFREHGILVSRFDANQCYQNPRGVVQDFLGQLGRHAADDTINTVENEFPALADD